MPSFCLVTDSIHLSVYEAGFWGAALPRAHQLCATSVPQCLERGALCQGDCCCMWVPCATAERCQLHAHRLSTSADAQPGADLAGRR